MILRAIASEGRLAMRTIIRMRAGLDGCAVIVSSATQPGCGL